MSAEKGERYGLILKSKYRLGEPFDHVSVRGHDGGKDVDFERWWEKQDTDKLTTQVRKRIAETIQNESQQK